MSKMLKFGAESGFLFAIDNNGTVYVGKPKKDYLINWIPVEGKHGSCIHKRLPTQSSDVEVSEREYELAKAFRLRSYDELSLRQGWEG